MIVSPNGSQMTQGQTVLDLGRERRHRRVRVPVRAQRRRHAGRRGVGPRSAPTLLREMGVEHVIDRTAEGYQFWNDDAHAGPGGVAPARQEDPRARRPRRRHRVRAPRPLDDGRVGVRAPSAAARSSRARRRSGFMIEYDNRYLWMNLKTLKGCHFANYREAWEANRLSCEGEIHPTLSTVFPFDQTRRSRVRRCTTTCTRASSACCARARGRPRRHRRRACASGTSTRSRCSAGTQLSRRRRYE